MVSISYSEAAVEVLDILEHTIEEEVNKIPKKFIEFLEENKSKTYISKLDHTKEIKDMELKPETEAILGLIYMKYWANEEEKEKFKEKIKTNEKLYQEKLRKEYNVEKLFKPKESTEETKLSIEVKQKTFLQKIIDKIKNIFGGKRWM